MEWTGWTAGIVDGEGSIAIIKRSRSDAKCVNNGYAMQIVVGNTDIKMIEKLVELWGGSICHKNSDTRVNRSDSWAWCVTAQKAANVLLEIVPFLVTKKNQAIVAMEFQDRLTRGLGFKGPNGNRASGLSEVEMEIRTLLYLKMKELNIRPGVRRWATKIG
jgi:hypothetical protein